MSIASKLAIGFLAAACMSTVSAAEEVILKIEKPEDFIQAKSVTESANDAMAIKGSYTALFSKQEIKVDPARKYRISGDFCLNGGKPVLTCDKGDRGCRPVLLFLGFVPYDKNKVQILPNAVFGSNKTLTTVAEDAKKGDKVIKVKDASKWDTKSPHSYIVFNAAEDYSDLPNRNSVHTVAPNARQAGEVWEITLKTPLKADIAAGTAVRQHSDGGTYIYTGGAFKTLGVWKTRTGTISGIAASGAPANKFWKGTETVRVLILALNGSKQSETEFKNIKVEEVKDVKGK